MKGKIFRRLPRNKASLSRKRQTFNSHNSTRRIDDNSRQEIVLQDNLRALIV